MPAANNMENHDRRENSGRASGPPRRVLLQGSASNARQKTTKKLAETMTNPAKLSKDQLLAPSSATLAVPGNKRVPTMSAEASNAVMKNTGLCISMLNRRMLSRPVW